MFRVQGLGCQGFRMFRIWDVQGLGCLGFRVLGCTRKPAGLASGFLCLKSSSRTYVLYGPLEMLNLNPKL